MEHQIQKEKESQKDSRNVRSMHTDEDAFDITQKRSRDASSSSGSATEITNEEDHGLRAYSAGDVARIARAMIKLRIGTHGEGTTWWKSADDRLALLKSLERLVREDVGQMSCYELACASLALCRQPGLDDTNFCQALLDAFVNKYFSFSS